MSVTKYQWLVYNTKTVDSAFHTLWLADQAQDIHCYSVIHLQLHRARDTKLALSFEQNGFPVCNEIWFGSFNR